MDPLEQLISHLYRSAQHINIAHYRSWALSQLESVIPFDAAIWSTGHLSTRTFHTHTTLNLPTHFPDVLIDNLSINPIRKTLFNKAGYAVDMADVIDDQAFYSSEIFEKVFQPQGIQRILSSIHISNRSGIYTLLSLYRFNREDRFSEIEKQRHQSVLFHLVEAASHACVLSLRTPDIAHTYYAICDIQGIYHEVEPGFLDLIEFAFPTQDLALFPFSLSSGEQMHQSLWLGIEQLGDLFRVSIRECSPIDRLTQREQDVVKGVTQGLSFKQIARKLELSPSTVANHLYRIYQKLNINNRAELAELLKLN